MKEIHVFGKNRRYKKAINETLGPNIHKQIRDALTLNSQALTKPKQMAFAAGYLRTATISSLQELGCEDPDTWDRMQKFLCDGVMPGKLWEIVLRALALMELDLEPQVSRAYTHGQKLGLLDRHMDGDLLTEYLVGDEVEYLEDEENREEQSRSNAMTWEQAQHQAVK
jgi:hypothetical protein